MEKNLNKSFILKEKRLDYIGRKKVKFEYSDCTSYLDIVDYLEIEKGDLIYLSSGLLKIMWLCNKKSEQFDANHLLDKLQQKVGGEGTILIPTYNFDFSNKGYYDIKNSKSTVGYLGNIALERSDFKRTKHPIHSFAVWGKDQKRICQLDNSNSFGDDSPFAYLLEHCGKEIGLGVSYMEGFTFIHYVEVKAGVPFRFNKTFSGIYVDEFGKATERIYDYPARDRTIDISISLEGLTKILESNNAGKRFLIGDVECYSLDFSKCYPNILKAMKENKCKDVFDFSIDRDYLFSKDFQICRE